MYKSTKISLIAALLLITIFISSAVASEFSIMQGWLISETCLQNRQSPCPLDGFSKDSLILFTISEKAFKIEGNGVEDWKLQKAYGQLIGLKGLQDGGSIKVTNIVQITGDKKLTKACK